MKKRFVGTIMAALISGVIISGCGQKSDDSAADTPGQVEENAESAVKEEETAKSPEKTVESSEENAESIEEAEETAKSPEETEETAKSPEETVESSEENAESTEEEEEPSEYEVVRVGSLKGPTTMGIVNLMSASDSGEAKGSYEFTMATQPDEIISAMISGDLDVAMIPANVASVLYNKSESGISLVDINTLGVLYCVTGDESVSSVADLSGKTLVTTGQGATPEYAINYLLAQNGVSDCSLEFKSEATEIAALLQEDATTIAVLPQPFATVAMVQNDALKTAFSLSDEWDKVTDDSRLITGVTVVRNDYLKEHGEEISVFLKEHEESAKKAAEDVDKTAELVASYGIIEKKEIAAKAIPLCNIVCISGDEAKSSLSGYLQTLYNADPKAVGGNLPGDDFYELTAE